MVTAALVLLLAQAPGQDLAGERSLVSKCEVSEDPQYGYTMNTPIRVGGLPLYGASRQQRYLRALAGPAGQPIAFRRRGAVGPNNEDVLIDLYEVSYAGLEKPIELYLDWYHWDPPKAPQGLLCGTEIGLAEPVFADPEHLRLAELAIEAARQGDVRPIPLGADGSAHYGTVLDTFRFMSGAARALILSGADITPQSLSGIRGGQLLVIANALSCDGQRRRPVGIDIGGPEQGALLDTAALRQLLPWVAVPDGALGRVFGRPHLTPGGAVILTYDGPACPSGSATVKLPVKGGPPKKIVDVPPAWPAALPPSVLDAPLLVVELRTRVGLDGVPEILEVVSGPQGFVQAAIDAVRQWRYEPMTINGEPAYAPIVMTVRISFTSRR